MARHLPWELDGNGFVAYPSGRQSPDVARLWPHHLASVGRWEWYWSVTVGGSTIKGIRDDKQEADDAATAAWPQAEADEVIRREVGRIRAELFDRAERYLAGAIDLNGIGIEAASYADALSLQMDLRVRWERTRPQGPGWGAMPPRDPRLVALMDALAAAFLRRRQGAQPTP